MSKRIAATMAALLFTIMALVVPSTPAHACKLGCLEDLVRISPKGANLGTFSSSATVAANWTIRNITESAVSVAVSPGSTGCVDGSRIGWQLDLDAGETAYVTTYHWAACVGSGTAWLSASQDQGYQYITFS